MTSCDNGHKFCMECARKASVTNIEIPCLGDCDSNFPQKEIQRFLETAVYAGWCHLKKGKRLDN